MKYVITGCFGFVGQYLVAQILREEPSAEIVAIDRRESPPGFPEITRSVALDQWIGLALIEEAESWHGKRLWAVSPPRDARDVWLPPPQPLSSATWRR